MKLIGQIAVGIVLAFALGLAIILFATVAIGITPAFGGFLGAVVGAPDFPIVLLALVAAIALCVWVKRSARRG